MKEQDWGRLQAEYRYYQSLYVKTFGYIPGWHIGEDWTRAIGKMKKAIETGEEYDVDKDPDYDYNSYDDKKHLHPIIT